MRETYSFFINLIVYISPLVFRKFKVFDVESSQSTIYKTTVAPLVTDFSTGRNCCVFAYGENGSGKTHTLFGPGVLKSNVRNYSNCYLDDETIEADEYSSLGSAGVSREPQVWNSRRKSSMLSPPEQILARKGVKHESQNGNGLERASEHSKMTEVGGNIRPPLHRIVESSGVVPRMVKDIFDIFRRRRRRNSTTNIDQPKLSVSFVEIYDNRVLDLLDLDIVDYVDDDDFSLSVVSTPERGVYVEDAIDIECRNESDVSAAIEVALHTREMHFRKASARGKSTLHVKVEKLHFEIQSSYP
jgi:Kinesin motor domain